MLCLLPIIKPTTVTWEPFSALTPICFRPVVANTFYLRSVNCWKSWFFDFIQSLWKKLISFKNILISLKNWSCGLLKLWTLAEVASDFLREISRFLRLNPASSFILSIFVSWSNLFGIPSNLWGNPITS